MKAAAYQQDQGNWTKKLQALQQEVVNRDLVQNNGIGGIYPQLSLPEAEQQLTQTNFYGDKSPTHFQDMVAGGRNNGVAQLPAPSVEISTEPGGAVKASPSKTEPGGAIVSPSQSIYKSEFHFRDKINAGRAHADKIERSNELNIEIAESKKTTDALTNILESGGNDPLGIIALFSLNDNVEKTRGLEEQQQSLGDTIAQGYIPGVLPGLINAR